MVHTSSVYKRIMAQKLRNRGYVSVSLGVINSLAQEGATVVSDLAPWSAGDIFKTKNTEKVEYATLEEKSIPADGSMVFMPETDQYKDNGISAVDVGDSIRVEFDNTYTLKGITIDFGQNYPTEFILQTDTDSYTLTNNSPKYENTSIILTNISFIEVQPVHMLYTNQRLRIREMLMGVGLYFDDSVIQNISCESYVSPISENVSYKSYNISIYDVMHQFDIDNPTSFMQFLESMQAIDISIGLDLGNNTIEWVKMGSVRLQSWSSKKNVLTLVATDRLSQLKNTYSLGNTIHTRTAYAELETILQDAGYERDEYDIDTYLENITLVNPVPECLHREAIQLVCNATRCVFFEDENGVLRIVANFANALAPADLTLNPVPLTEWSDYPSILSNAYNEYGDLSRHMNLADGHQLFLPENQSEYLSSTGVATAYVALPNGFLTNNALADIKFPAAFAYHAVTVNFAGVVPERINITAFNVNNGWEEMNSQDFDELQEENTLILEDFGPFNAIVITIQETEANARTYITKVSFDDATDYVLSSEIMTDDIQPYINETIRSTKVKIYTFENDEQQKPREVEDSVYETTTIALTGIDRTCTNQLISNTTQAKAVADWLALYYKSNIDYNATFRGEPALQANDIITLETKFKNIKVCVEKTSFSFNGAFSGKLELRRVNYTNEEE